MLAIFSPAKEAAENIIESIRPAVTPIAISFKITDIPYAEVSILVSISRGWVEKTIIDITNAIKILTLSIIKRALKRGAAIIKALSLILVKKNANSTSIIFCRPKPGIISFIECSIY